MADVVDNVLGASRPEPNQAASGPGAPTGSDQGGQHTPRAEERIRELIAEREALKQQYYMETGQLKSELEQLKAQVGQITNQAAQSDKQVSSWADLSDSQLREVMKESSDNPDVQVAAMEELARRVAERKLSEFRESHESDEAKKAYRSQVYQQIVKDFGQEAADPNSELHRRADAHYAELRRIYRQIHGQSRGDEMLAMNPEAEYACFAKAASEIWAPQKDELNRLRGEVEKFKQAGSMAIGRTAAAPPPDEVTEAVKRGDWRQAIRKLPIIPS